jgi:hypothetical protein
LQGNIILYYAHVTSRGLKGKQWTGAIKDANEHCLNAKKCIGTETGQVNYVQKVKTKYYVDHLK